MKYVFTFGGDPMTLDTLPPAEAERAQTKMNAWWRIYRKAGKILDGAQLRAPLTATTIRFGQGGPSICDGTFTDEGDAIGGFGLIEAEDLDEALEMAMAWPAGGFVEIPPLRVPEDDVSEEGA